MTPSNILLKIIIKEKNNKSKMLNGSNLSKVNSSFKLSFYTFKTTDKHE